MGKLLKVCQVAERTGLTVRAILYQIEKATLPAQRLGENGIWFVKEEDLERLIISNCPQQKDKK